MPKAKTAQKRSKERSARFYRQSEMTEGVALSKALS